MDVYDELIYRLARRHSGADLEARIRVVRARQAIAHEKWAVGAAAERAARQLRYRADRVRN